MIGQTESISEKLTSFFGITKAGSAADDCGANGPGGGGFQAGNTCGGKGDGGSSSPTSASSGRTQPESKEPAKTKPKTASPQAVNDMKERIQRLHQSLLKVPAGQRDKRSIAILNQAGKELYDLTGERYSQNKWVKDPPKQAQASPASGDPKFRHASPEAKRQGKNFVVERDGIKTVRASQDLAEADWAQEYEREFGRRWEPEIKSGQVQKSHEVAGLSDESETAEKLASFFGFTKESSCGANSEGGGGFQPGNTCAAEDGDGGDDYNPDKENMISNDGPSQHSDMLHNIKTDPTKQDRAELLQFAKDVATFKIRKDSLLRRAIKELTTDPTAEDRGRAFKYAGDILSLKPAVDFVTGKNRGPNPAGDDLKIITGGVRKVVNATVGNLVRLVGRNIAESRASGAPIPDRVNNHRVPMMVRSFTKAVEADGQDQLVEQITDEVLRRAGDYTDADVIQEAILDVMEEVLSGEFPPHEQTIAKAGGISGTTGSTGGFLQGKRAAAVESDWLNHEFDPDDYDPPERDR